MKKRLILFLISFSLLASLIYLSGPLKIWNALLSVRPVYILLAFSVSSLLALLRGYRWQYFLKNIGIEISFLKATKLYIAGLFISNLSPAKTADPVRSVLLKKTEGKSFSKSLSSIFLERILDLVILISISLGGVLFFGFSLKFSLNWFFLAIGIYTVLMILGIFVISSKERTQKVAGKLVSVFSFIDRVKQLEEKVEHFSQRISTSLRMYRDKKVLAGGICLTAAAWFFSGVIPFLIFRSLGFPVPYQIVLTVRAMALLLSVVTLLPGGLGSGEVISVVLYTSFLTIPLGIITTSLILGRFVSLGIYAFVGSVILATLDVKEFEEIA